MSNPTAVEVLSSVQDQATLGALREIWIKIAKNDGSALSAAADCDQASQLYYIENPFGYDVVITKTLAVVTALDAQDGDIDAGLADDIAGSNKGVELVDSLVNTAVAVLDQTVQGAIASTVVLPVWKAGNQAHTAVDSFISIWQNGDADVTDLRWYLLVKCIPYKDLATR